MPGIGPLYDPPPPFVVASSLPSLLASVADVRHVPSFENLSFYLWKVVPLVKAQVLPPVLPGSGSFDHDAVQRFHGCFHVMRVGGRYDNG